MTARVYQVTVTIPDHDDDLHGTMAAFIADRLSAGAVTITDVTDVTPASPATPPASDRVAAGAALLDANVPGWATEIDTATLDILTMRNCLGGQLGGGDFFAGVRRILALSAGEYFWFQDLRDNGLCGIGAADGGDTYREDCDALTAAWRTEITARTVTA